MVVRDLDTYTVADRNMGEYNWDTSFTVFGFPQSFAESMNSGTPLIPLSIVVNLCVCVRVSCCFLPTFGFSVSHHLWKIYYTLKNEPF